MKMKNVQSLERLSLFCHMGGLSTALLGIVTTLMFLMNKDFGHIQVGIFIVAIGYALVKIAAVMTNVLADEKSSDSISGNKWSSS